MPDKHTKILIGLALASSLLIQFCSLRGLNKHLIPWPGFLGIIVILSFCAYLLLFNLLNKPWAAKILASKYLTMILLLLILMANLFFYPKADALKLTGGGTDTDDAVIAVCTKLFHGEYPYEKTYLGNRVSTGPGLGILLSPFALIPHAYAWMTPFFIFLFTLISSSLFSDRKITNTLLLLLTSCVGFWEYMFIGYDFFAISCMFCGSLFLFYKYQNKLPIFLFIGILFGLLCTSRIIFIYLIPLLSFAWFKINPPKGLLLFAVSLLTCLFTHYFFYEWGNGDYQPLHLIEKGQKTMNPFLLSATIVLFGYVVYRFVRTTDFTLEKIFFFFWLFMLIPLFIISVGRIVADNFDLKLTEGPGYLLPQLLLFLLYIGFNLKKQCSNDMISSLH